MPVDRQHAHTASNKRRDLEKTEAPIQCLHILFLFPQILSTTITSVFFKLASWHDLWINSGNEALRLFLSHFSPQQSPSLVFFHQSRVKLKLNSEWEDSLNSTRRFTTWMSEMNLQRRFTTAVDSVVLVFSLLFFLMPSCFIPVEWIPDLGLMDWPIKNWLNNTAKERIKELIGQCIKKKVCMNCTVSALYMLVNDNPCWVCEVDRNAIMLFNSKTSLLPRISP